MTPTLTIIAGSALLFMAGIFLYLENRSLRRQVKELEDDYDKECGRIIEINFTANSIPLRTAYVREDGINHRYEVYVKADDDMFIIRSYRYCPADPADRDYKRIHAHEVADLLNEKP